MKLCRYGPNGSEKPGLVDAAGRLRDLSGVIADLTVDAISTLAALDPDTLPLVEGTPRYGVPVAGIGKFLAIGLNYADHAREAGLEPPPEPIFFTKAISCLNGPNDDVMIPDGSRKTDWEVELGVVIGKTCRYVPEAEALSHVAGFVLVNDVSERAFRRNSAASGTRARAATPSARSARGWSLPTRSPIARRSTCFSMSTASGCRPGTRGR